MGLDFRMRLAGSPGFLLRVELLLLVFPQQGLPSQMHNSSLEVLHREVRFGRGWDLPP